MCKAITRAVLLTVVLLAACGKQQPNWTGGLVDVWEPTGKQIGVMILHQGHDCFAGCRYDDSLVPVAEAFAAAGFRVYGFEMPPEPHDAGPIERYFQPVIDFLDKIEPGMPIYMAGLSGGGWATSVVTALDTRIVRGYSVDGDPASSDWEQQHPPHPYETLYAMAGDRLTHVYIPREPGGSPTGCASLAYSCHYDWTVDRHTFSPWAVSLILAEVGAVWSVR